jgi:hypothetical protein
MEQPLTKFASITRRSKDIRFMDIQMKTQSWTCRFNDINGFSHFLRIFFDSSIIKIPRMKKEVEVVYDLMNERL